MSSCHDLGRYGYYNDLWGLRRELSKNETNSTFMRGIETSFRRYSLPEIEESQFFVSLPKETQELLELAELRLKKETGNKQMTKLNLTESVRENKNNQKENSNSHMKQAVNRNSQTVGRKSQTEKRDSQTEHRSLMVYGERGEKSVKSDSNTGLVVATEHLRLTRDGWVWWKWKIGHIRRFGCNDTCFYFETGRHAKTGEGVFVFSTGQGKQIYRQVTEMKSLCQLDALCQRGVAINTLAPLPAPLSPSKSPAQSRRVVRGASLRVRDGEESSGSRGILRRGSAPDTLVEQAHHPHTFFTPQPPRPHRNV